ncbi:MAG: hypothetical protein ACR2QM_15165 [Longimicrobiales bacterium]
MSTRSSAAALLAAVFFAGVAGTLGVLRVVEHQDSSPETSERFERRGGGPEGIGSRGGSGRDGGRRFGTGFSGSELASMELSERLADRLKLTDEQRVQVEAAMERRRKVAEETMEQVFPRLKSQMDSLQTEIEEILNEEQIEAFRRFQAGGDRFRRRDRGRRSSQPN